MFTVTLITVLKTYNQPKFIYMDEQKRNRAYTIYIIYCNIYYIYTIYFVIKYTYNIIM